MINQNRIKPLASDFVKVYESQYPSELYCYSPGICKASNGRLVATLDLSGPKITEIGGPVKKIEGGKLWQGKVFTSDDGGKTWQHRTDFPYMHARPFVAGNSIYVLGQADDLVVIRSDDNGETWSEQSFLTEGEFWHQAPCNVHYANNSVYLVMEKRIHTDVRGWNVCGIAPVLMRGKVVDDLTKRENWSFASELVFLDNIPEEDLDFVGIPFYETKYKERTFVFGNRSMNPVGWLETNVVQFVDPNHYWYDPNGKTFHLWARAHTGGTGYAAIAKVVEHPDGSMETMLEKVPSGKEIVFVPCPGGQMKFHIVYDDVTELYWLLSSQATDSMTRADLLPEDRFSLPNNERHRLQLHFSKNCIDWCFAGLVDMGDSYREARHYASMIIDDDRLLVLSRSGDHRAKNAHDGNFISFHVIDKFRGLVY